MQQKERLFIGEFITGGGLRDQALPPHLAVEGGIMLDALLADLIGAGYIDIIAARDPRLAPLPAPVECAFVTEPFEQRWRSCMDSADLALLIAPEHGDILLRLTAMAEHGDSELVGSAAAAVRWAASKLKTAKMLARHGLDHIRTCPLGATPPHGDHGWIIKPDDGVGAEECYFCADHQALQQRIAALDRSRRFVVQPYVPGLAASLSMICRLGKAQLLACNRQQLTFEHGKAALQGLIVNDLTRYWAAFDDLAQSVARVDRRLSGYVGVDLIISGDRLIVVEINPRLTTSYAGLHSSLSVNPAQLLLAAQQGGDLAPLAAEQCAPVVLTLANNEQCRAALC